MSPRFSRCGMMLALLVVAADSASFGLVLPVLPDLVSTAGASTIGDAARMGGLMIAAFALAHLVTAPLFGALSDGFGRRRVLIVALGCGAVGHLGLTMADSLLELVSARALTGLAGAAGIAVTAMIADITADEDRATALGLLAAADGTGFILGPALAGLFGEYDLRVPFFIAAGMNGALLAAALTLLPETLARNERRAFSMREALPHRGLSLVWRVVSTRRLLVSYGLAGLGVSALPIVWPYYAAVKFGWGPGEVGFILALLGGATITANTVFLPFFRRLLPDRIGLPLLLVGSSGAMLLLSFLPFETFQYAFVIIIAPMSIWYTIIISQLSRLVSSQEQGALQGVFGTVDSATSILAPFLFPWIFSVAIAGNSAWAGAPFLAASLCVLSAGVILFWRLK